MKEGIAGYAGLASFYPMAPHRHALAHGDNTTETITSAKNKSRSALQSVVLQHRGDDRGESADSDSMSDSEMLRAIADHGRPAAGSIEALFEVADDDERS